jgi:hypothetical protein
VGAAGRGALGLLASDGEKRTWNWWDQGRLDMLDSYTGTTREERTNRYRVHGDQCHMGREEKDIAAGHGPAKGAADEVRQVGGDVCSHAHSEGHVAGMELGFGLHEGKAIKRDIVPDEVIVVRAFPLPRPAASGRGPEDMAGSETGARLPR